MSALCPPPSPAVAKTEIALSGGSPLLAATFTYWDNILGPRVRHIWAPKTEQQCLSDGEIIFLANHTLNGEILRNTESRAIDVKFFVLAEKGVIIVSVIFDRSWNGDRSTYGLSIILPQSELSFYLPLHRVCVDKLTHIIRKGRIWMQKGQSIIPILTGEVIPVMELLSSMKLYSAPEEIDINDTTLSDDDIGDSCPEAEQTCSRLCRNETSFEYESGLFVQGLLKDATRSSLLPFRQVLYAPYPTTHIDVHDNTVKQMPLCHEHIYNQRRYMRSELTAIWKAASDEEMAQDAIIRTDDSFTPDLYVSLMICQRNSCVTSMEPILPY